MNGLILQLLDSVGEDEWGRGISAPTKWDPLFPEYMTLEQLFRYPALHLRSHLTQIAR